MPNHLPHVLIVALLTATAAIAHTGVKNEQVKARMASMEVIGKQTKVLGQMAKGQVAYDTGVADAALAKIVTHAQQVPMLFEPQADDPMSEARAAIWTDWDDFVEKSDALITSVNAADTSDLDAFRLSFREIGKACGACHEAYRD